MRETTGRLACNLLLIAALAGATATASPVRPGTALAQETAPGGSPADLARQAGDIAESVLDELVEQGVLTRPVDYDDPVLTEQRRIVAFGEINSLAAREIVSKMFFLAHRDGVRPIDLFIRTNGGWGDDAFAICDAMQVLPCPVNTWAMGSCDSAGSYILAAGTGKRRVLPHALVTLHFVEDEGDEEFSTERAGRIRNERFWARYARLPEAFGPSTGDHSHALSPGEAVRFGVADEVVPHRERAAADGKGE